MRRFLVFLSLLAAVFAASTSAAQGAVREAVPQVAETLHRWLESGDPRLVAWAAFHVANSVPASSVALPGLQTHLIHLVQMYEPVSTWTMAPKLPELTHDQVLGSRATLMVLNALMTRHAALAPDDAVRLYPEFGAVALALLRNYCQGKEDAGCRGAWMEFVRRPAYLGDQIAAADVLADQPPAGYSEALLKRVFFQVDVTVTSGENGIGPGSSSSCGACGIKRTEPGWPPAKKFFLSWNSSQKDAVPWVASPVPMYLEEGVCQPSGPDFLSPSAYVYEIESRLKLRLVAAVLGLGDAEMPVALHTAVPVRWVDAEHYRTEIDAAYLRVRTGVGALLKELESRGLLTQEAAAELTGPKNSDALQIRFDAYDARPGNEQTSPLPSIRFHDPHALWERPGASNWMASAY